jgi:hypothetical protein
VALSRVVLPSEHGGWAFLGEPIVLGLLVAPSSAGALLALAAIAGFLARQPLRLFVGDRRRGRRYPRTAQAERAFALLAFAGGIALAGSIVLAHGPVLVVLGLAAPMAAAALAMDLGARPREAAAEVLAPLALAAVAAGIAVAGGVPRATALGLWAVLAARDAPAVLYVRARLRLDRGEAPGLVLPLASHVVAIAAVAMLAARAIVPWPAAAAMVLLLARAAWGLSPLSPRWKPLGLGLSEIAFGMVTVLAVVLGRR